MLHPVCRYRSESAKFRYMAAEMSSTLRRDRKIGGATDCDMEKGGEVKGDASLVKEKEQNGEKMLEVQGRKSQWFIQIGDHFLSLWLPSCRGLQ